MTPPSATAIALDTATQQLITTEQAWHYRVIPLRSAAGTLELYVDENNSLSAVQEEWELLTGKQIVLHPVTAAALDVALQTYYRRQHRGTSAGQPTAAAQTTPGSDAFIRKLIDEASQLSSSDLHLEPYESRCRVRFRIDGQMVERYVLDKKEYPAMVNQVKIMANLDIAEKRLPQDGRIFFTTNQGKIDLRVSVLPTLHGEKIVLRLLGSDAAHLNLSKLGLSATDFQHYQQGIRKPHGMLLISGPTGSGKTTTLYATLKELNDATRNILTIEDPIEYTLEGINQVQLKESIGLDFGKALRTFLRQDPDIIMVGEIRDRDTAQMAVRAALTGHLVLSTIHTNSAWGTVSRLVDMGIPNYLVAATLNTSVAQRLLRLLCPHCKAPVAVQSEDLPPGYKAPRALPQEHFRPQGCAHCYHTGYAGRRAIYEVIPIDHEVAQRVKDDVPRIDDLLQQRQIYPLAHQAFELWAHGETSMEEIYPLLLNE